MRFDVMAAMPRKFCQSGCGSVGQSMASVARHSRCSIRPCPASVGVDHDTASFAVNAIRRWWRPTGSVRYPHATTLAITADGGGGNGSRVRLWKIELGKLANELGLVIAVHRLPPGTSKWNKIEHRLFSFNASGDEAKQLNHVAVGRIALARGFGDSLARG
jgi:Rhodopirellula transposase DDE domain